MYFISLPVSLIVDYSISVLTLLRGSFPKGIYELNLPFAFPFLRIYGRMKW